MARNIMTREPAGRDLEVLGQDIRRKYGSALDWKGLLELLEDRDLIPQHCEIVFDADPLLPGECAHLAKRGISGENGYVLYIHPVFQFQLSQIPFLVLQQVAFMTAGGMTSAEQAERFGASVLGISADEYYQVLCDLAAQVGGDDLC
jgi:hypothetical protein